MTTTRHLDERNKLTAMTALIQARNSRKVGIRPSQTRETPVALRTDKLASDAIDDGMGRAITEWPGMTDWDLVGCDDWTPDGEWLSPETFGSFNSIDDFCDDPTDVLNGNSGPAVGGFE